MFKCVRPLFHPLSVSRYTLTTNNMAEFPGITFNFNPKPLTLNPETLNFERVLNPKPEP